jgi:hypothetical protein
MSGKGVDNVRTVIELGIKTGVINKGGAWYRWNSPEGEIKGQGLASFTEQLSESHIEAIFAEVKPYLAEPKKSKEEKKSNLESEIDLEADLDDMIADL